MGVLIVGIHHIQLRNLTERVKRGMENCRCWRGSPSEFRLWSSSLWLHWSSGAFVAKEQAQDGTLKRTMYSLLRVVEGPNMSRWRQRQMNLSRREAAMYG